MPKSTGKKGSKAPKPKVPAEAEEEVTATSSRTVCTASTSTASTSTLPASPLSVILTTGDVSFTVSRALLCGQSPYFDAMLNGHFIEANQRQIFLHSITADAMEYILNYLNFNIVNPVEVDNVKDIFHAANYFGLETLCTKVEKMLIYMVNDNTYLQIYLIAKLFNLKSLEAKLKSKVLCLFNEAKSQISHIADIHTLYWYLSHHNLCVDDEIEVFKAGCEWLTSHSDGSDDDILVILCCIIYQNIEKSSLELMLKNKYVAENATARRVIEGIIHISDTYSISGFFKDENRKTLQEYFDRETYEIINGILMSKKRRVPPLRPCILKNKTECVEIMTYNIHEKKLEEFATVPGIPWWGQSIVSWNGFTVFALGGKIKIKDFWNYDVRMYDCITEQWHTKSTLLTPRRHATVLVNDDKIYVIGGFGQFRIMLNSVHVYHIKKNEWSELPDFPEFSTNAVACFHKGNLYVSGDHFYVFRSNQWQHLGSLQKKQSSLLSYNGRLYFTERWLNTLFCWDKDVINFFQCEPISVKKSHYNVANMCKIGNTAYIFSEGDNIDWIIGVESCDLDEDLNGDGCSKTNLLWTDTDTYGYYSVISVAFLLADYTVIDESINTYGERWLKS